MKTRAILFMVAIILMFCNISYAQNLDSMKRSFKKITEKELINRIEEENDKIMLPEYDDKVTKRWVLSKVEYKTNYSYDIVKTDSVLSLYRGIVIYRAKFSVKTGKTKEECLSTHWVYDESDIKIIYFYKNGKWVQSGY